MSSNKKGSRVDTASPRNSDNSYSSNLGGENFKDNSNRQPTPLAIARDYLGRMWAPIPVPYKKKKPVIEGWPNLMITEENVAEYFGHGQQNIGVLLGNPSNGLTDVDVDEKTLLPFANLLFPQTLAFGRAGKPKSHFLFYADGAETVQYKDYENVD